MAGTQTGETDINLNLHLRDETFTELCVNFIGNDFRVTFQRKVFERQCCLDWIDVVCGKASFGLTIPGSR